MSDALAFGARQKGKWGTSSEYDYRTYALDTLDTPDEDAPPGKLIQVAAVWSADHRITVYRNGALYGSFMPAPNSGTGLLPPIVLDLLV